jgi:ABC-type transport system substrate-binding protein
MNGRLPRLWKMRFFESVRQSEWISGYLGIALLALATAGCGNDPNPAPLHKKRPDGSPWLVRYAYNTEEIRSLDPQVSYDQVSRRVLEPVQDTLLTYHVMKTDPYELVPLLLEKMPERVANSDGTVAYLCQLKRGILFHDDPCFPNGKGREVVAKDVQFAFQRLSDPAVQCPVFATLAEYVAGMNDAFAAGKANGRFDYDQIAVTGIELLDSHTFKIHLLKPYPQILYWLAMHFTTPVAREAVEYYDGKEHPDGPGGKNAVRPQFQFHPVGNGPFELVEWVRGQRYRFVRHEGYRTVVFPSDGWPPEREAINRPLAGHSLPLVDEVQMTIFREILPIWLLARQGYLDRVGVMKDAVNTAITASRELTPKYADRGMKLERALEVSTFFMIFNMQDPLLGKNKKLRQAISCAYDPQGYSEMLYGGVAPVAQQLLPPGIYGFAKEFRNPYGFNLAKARQLLVEAGYPGGRDPTSGEPLEITMDTAAAGGEERQLAEYQQRQIEQLGIRVRVIENTFARLMEKEDQGNFQIAASSGWGADYPDAENFFFLFYGANFPPVGKNAGRFKNPEFDRLFEEMSTMENTPERRELITKMNDILIEECPIVLNFNKAYYVVAQPWAPVTHNNMLLEGGLCYLPVDAEMRARCQREWNPVAKWPPFVAAGLVAVGLVYGIRLNRRRNV